MKLLLCLLLLVSSFYDFAVAWSNRTAQEYYMRIAIELAKEAVASGGSPYGALIVDPVASGGSPYGALIVDPRKSKVVVKGRNHAGHNPIWHAEMDAINGLNNLLPQNTSVYAVAKDLELYTSAESCSMCMSAITWSGFGRVIYGTSIPYIESQGQNQIDIRSVEVAKASAKFANTTVIGGILAEETNKLYQRNSKYRKFIEESHRHIHHHSHVHN